MPFHVGIDRLGKRGVVLERRALIAVVLLHVADASLNARPSCVLACTRSYAHTWSRRCGRSLMHEPSVSHSRPRLGCFLGTFSPSRRQIRSTRLWFTRQPSSRSIAVTLRYPYRP